MEAGQLDQLFEDHHLINKVIKLRLYPTDELADALPQLSGNERFVWNRCVTFNRYYHALFPNNDPVDNYALIPEMTRWKKRFEFLKCNDATGLQKVVERFSTSLKNMLNYYKGLRNGKRPRKIGFPKYKSKKHDLQAFGGKVVNRNLRVVDENHLKLPKFKEPQRVSSTVGLAGWKIKEYRVHLLGDGAYELNLFVEGDIQVMKHSGKITGVDCNLKNLITLSNGKTYPSFKSRQLRNLMRRSIKYQRKMSRAYHRAQVIMRREQEEKALIQHDLSHFKNYWKYRRLFNHYNLKIKRIKLDYYNKVANDIVQNYDVIVFEKLNVQNMMKNHFVAKAIGNASWYLFRQIVTYKALWNNKLVMTVGPQYTTQTCYHCGFVHGIDDNYKIGPSQRSWRCPRCGHTLRRDQNAAINIEKRFLKQSDKYLKQQFNALWLFDPHKFARNHTNILWKNALETYASVL